MPLTVRQRSIHNKNGAKKGNNLTKGKRKKIEEEFLVTSAPSDLKSIAYPGGAVTLALLLIARITSAYFGQIADCDETFNYWEPLHYLVYGTGLQTWEYSPQYAIRSYMPLWLYAASAKTLARFMSPVSVFYSLRVLLAVASACAELAFYKAICHEFGVNIGRLWLGLTVPAAGMFASASAMLPSAWSNALVAGALASWWRRRYGAAVFLTAASAILSWPFTVILGLPIAIDLLLLKRQIFDFVKWSLISLLVLLMPTVLVDSWHYGRLVVAPWNIVAYNIFTEHGPDLYGVEPWTYYFINGFLNFNIVWILALGSAPLLLICSELLPLSTSRSLFHVSYWLNLMPMYLWLAVFMLQSHKEERFLYPVYTLIVLSAAISLDCLQKLTYAAATNWLPRAHRIQGKRHYLAHTGAIMYVYALVAAGLALSRMTSLYVNYHGPMRILGHLPPPTGTGETVCFGKDWYRSPSSFHLPPGYSTRFIQSEFTGQLPAPYSSLDNATRIIHPHFNDLNKGDNRTYLKPAQCHYLVDSDLGTPTRLQPAYHKDSTWEVIATVPILDANNSHQILRAFYIPFLSSRNVFSNIYLLKNKVVV